MTDSTVNGGSIRQVNARAVLDVVWTGDVVTASDIIEGTGLSRASAHDLCDQLMTSGWIREVSGASAADSARVGRPARRYTLQDRAGVVVGVEAGPGEIGAVVTDLRGRELSRRVVRSNGTLDGDRRVRLIKRALREALRSAAVPVADVLCLVIGVSAPVDAEGRTVLRHNPYWEAMNPDLVDRLRAHGQTVLVDNDVNLAATAEAARGHARGVRDHVTLMIDEGFGAAVVLGGQLLRGAHGATGEMRFLDHVDGVGSPSGIGALAVQLAREELARPERTESCLARVDAENLDAATVLAAAGGGDLLALRVEAELAKRLTRVVATLATVLDPALVVLAGHIAPHCERLRDAVQRGLPDYLEAPRPRVEVSALGGTMVTAGAVDRGIAHVRASALELLPRQVTVAPQP